MKFPYALSDCGKLMQRGFFTKTARIAFPY